ncbi:N-acetyl-gamma-glutamyl-phosphate reductase [Skermanella rosea]|uniref:N-acetyl-gamma-glutamyl-phosphate reductase n=1 Tax=Skermanella rosea TaxID=1817965 RepID=UPI0019332652|nr:N-acetyl-gamma-glutamyl-phosphate reductase [Skermanella rosea]UEM04120.1 N-acetyl-gamma-glutamyl-phosphate reductase [Skermanella rosea]
MPETVDRIRIAILGASGYTGAELVRMLARHPAADIRVLTAERQAGKPLSDVFPHLAYLKMPDLVKVEQVDWSEIDFVFCGLPHGTTQEIIRALPHSLRVVDLSADFRLSDAATYAEWYGHEHQAVELQAEAVYGLTEFNRQGVRNARLVANPGCYPTATLIPLLPLVLDGLIETDDIIVDAKSGVSGAGRDAKQQNLFCEVSEGMHAYGVGRHRHMPEMEQELSLAAGKPVTMAFTPHLIPMNRGEFVTTYVRLAGGNTPDDLRAALAARFEAEPFVQVLPAGVVPHTKHVRGSNQIHISVFPDRIKGRAIVLSVIDNLVKGASGQAIQNMNVMAGLIETMGLEQAPLFP